MHSPPLRDKLRVIFPHPLRLYAIALLYMSTSSSNSENIDDASGQITYLPSSAWILDTTLGAYQPINGTIHGTTQSNASATLKFTGPFISVTCLVSPTGANISIILDSQQVATVNTAVALLTQTTTKTIWSKDGLDGGSHEIILIKLPNDPDWNSSVPGDLLSHLNLDSFSIEGSSNPSTQSHKDSTPAIVGAVLGVVALAVLLVGLWYFLRRRRTRNDSRLVTQASFSEGEKVETPRDISSWRQSSTVASSSSPSIPLASRRRNEKATPLGDASAAGAGEGTNGRGRWRSSLLGLPHGRVLNLNEERPRQERSGTVPGSTDRTGAINIANHTDERVSRGVESSLLRSPIPETSFSPTSEASVSPSTVPESSAPTSSAPPPFNAAAPPSIPTSGEKSSQQTHELSGDEGALGSGTVSSSRDLLSTTSGSHDEESGLSPRALQRELVALRQQVVNLTRLHTGRPSTEIHDEPPPEYEGRQGPSDDEDDER